MRSNSREEVVEVFDALAADLDRALELDFDVLTTPEQLALLQRCEVLRRRLPAVEHPLVNAVAAAERADLGGEPRAVLADRLGISRADARRRIDAAAELGARRTLTGEPLPPLLPATAAAQRHGRLGHDHIQVIRDFFDHLPDAVDAGTRQQAETHLAGLAGEHRPDELTKLAHRLYDCINPDGQLDDTDRQRRRGITLTEQGRDGMSRINGWLDPQARATLDAVLAKLAGPGMANPADDQPCLSGTPSQQAIDNDTRTAAQRTHDALTAMARALLASGDLGQHNGLPATVIVSVSLAELQAATGKAHTGGGTWLPMPDVIRLASHAHCWLRIFDDSKQGVKEVALFHTKRLATPGQRIVLHARDRGCTHPSCPVPGYHCDAHHTNDYAITGHTDADDLTWRCGRHHSLITNHGWTTRRRTNGDIETIPPPHADHGQPRTNQYHHPENLLGRNRSNADDEDDDGYDGEGGEDENTSCA